METPKLQKPLEYRKQTNVKQTRANRILSGRGLAELRPMRLGHHSVEKPVNPNCTLSKPEKYRFLYFDTTVDLRDEKIINHMSPFTSSPASCAADVAVVQGLF